MKQVRRLLPLLLALLLLTGCAFSGAEELYALPRRSDVLLGLQKTIDGVMHNASYAAPLSGANLRTIQNADLDGDGIDEILVFARIDSPEQPLNIFVFRRQENGDYLHWATFEVDGAAFDSVRYAQIDGRPGLETVVSSRLSGEGLQSLHIFSMHEGEPQDLLYTGCKGYAITDLNGDGLSDLLTINTSVNSSNGLVVYYRWREDRVGRSGEAPLSVSAESVRSIFTGEVAVGVPALFVASSYDDSSLLTDVFVALDEDFRNIVYGAEVSSVSASKIRSHYVYGTDIDQDGAIELPEIKPLPVIPNDSGSHDQSCILWYNLLPDGTHVSKYYTYHNYDEGWYLKLEAGWIPILNVTLREDKRLGPCTCFLITNFTTRSELLRVYVLQGSTATDALEDGSVFLLGRLGDNYYCASFGKGYETESSELQERFGFITTENAS